MVWKMYIEAAMNDVLKKTKNSNNIKNKVFPCKKEEAMGIVEWEINISSNINKEKLRSDLTKALEWRVGDRMTYYEIVTDECFLIISPVKLMYKIKKVKTKN